MASPRGIHILAVATGLLGAIGCEPPDGEGPETGDGTCPLLSPTGPTYTPSSVDSPCPEALPTQELFGGPTCSFAAFGETTCLYPSDDPTIEYLCWCRSDSSWSCYPQYCRRPVERCTDGATTSWPTVALPDDCSGRPITACDGRDRNAQSALDIAVYDAMLTCPETACWDGAMLTVYFEDGCAKSYAWNKHSNGWAPPYTTDGRANICVEHALASLKVDCAAGLECGVAAISNTPLLCGSL